METQKDSTKVNEELTNEQRVKFWDEINKEKYGWDPTDLNRMKIDVPDYIKALKWAWNRTIYYAICKY